MKWGMKEEQRIGRLSLKAANTLPHAIIRLITPTGRTVYDIQLVSLFLSRQELSVPLDPMDVFSFPQCESWVTDCLELASPETNFSLASLSTSVNIF